jgi:23S rRNA (uracil1939-C5)-methyltransferase
MSPSSKARRSLNRAPLEVELHLGEWGAKGATTAQVDGHAVLVDRGVPDEWVRATIDRRRKAWRGVVNAVLEPSPDRIQPPCPAYTAGCGGCQWQHLAYPAQFSAKRALVDRAMEHEAVRARVSAGHAMPYPWRYRRTAAIALGWEAGFRPRGRRGIIEIRDCPISHPLIGAFASQLNDLLQVGRIPPYHGNIWLDSTVVGTASEPRLQVVIQGIEGLTLENHPELADLANIIAACESVVSVAFRHRSGSVCPLIGPLDSPIQVAGLPMWVPAGAFTQTNVEMLDRLIERIEPDLTKRAPRHVADLYGGVGTFALTFAGRVDHMTLVELDISAVSAAQQTARDRGIENMSFLAQHAERALPVISELDLVIVDPPRSGLGTVVTEALAASSAHSIVYVSCSPVSLASDLAALQSHGFMPVSLEMFDFYPQTYHVECLTILDRAP